MAHPLKCTFIMPYIYWQWHEYKTRNHVTGTRNSGESNGGGCASLPINCLLFAKPAYKLQGKYVVAAVKVKATFLLPSSFSFSLHINC